MKKKHYVYMGILALVIIGLFFLFDKPDYTVKGIGFDNTPAKVVITEYSDFQCPACGAAYPILKQIKEEYTREQVKIDYKHFPLTQIHPFALKAAQAAECARDQDKFEPYHNKLFDNQKDLRAASLKTYAAQLELNTEEFNACLDSNAMLSRVQGNLAEGINRGVGATPTFFILGKKYEGIQSFQSLKNLIDVELAK
ncbi:MAG: thioredoxin domain-containing protein [Candidatus Nanoarchaeia archaeon]